ncbi:MAG: LPP20 family lipoprotein [Idiomarina sp.]|nr:LPP20 family lipoprotein [Idiomarina sp.]
MTLLANLGRLLIIGFLFTVSSSYASDSAWWQHPPQDSDETLYGIGEGFSLEQAQQNALNSIAGKLSTQLSSSLQRLSQETTHYSSDHVRRQVQSNVAEVQLSQFQTLRVMEHGRITRVLLALDRLRLAEIWRQQIADDLDYLVPLMQQGDVTSLAHWLELNAALALAVTTRSMSLSLQALDGTPPGPNIERALQEALRNQSLSIEIKGPLPEFNRAIRQELSRQGIHECHQSCDITIEYTPSFTRQHMFSEFTSTLNLETTVRERNRQIVNHNLQSRASSVVSAQSADQNVVTRASRALLDSGLWKSLGINI